MASAYNDERVVPRGTKCKMVKAKISRKAVKQEPLDDADSLGAIGGTEDVVDKMLTLSIGEGKDSAE